jgi:hypothetical protein
LNGYILSGVLSGKEKALNLSPGRREISGQLRDIRPDKIEEFLYKYALSLHFPKSFGFQPYSRVKKIGQ